MSNAGNASETQSGTEGGRFASLTSLRAAHSELLKRHRQEGVTPGFATEVEAFVQRGRATGALLDDDEDRWAGQSLLDYWVTMLDRADLVPPDATLDEFDPALAPELPDELCPYQGLDAFREDDHEVFFGRQRLVGEMIAQVERGRLLAVVGPSGSGKSSLVRAGIVPALKGGAVPGSEGWRYAPSLVPGSNPLAKLARALRPDTEEAATWIQERVAAFLQSEGHLAQLASEPDGRPLVLIIDQFEEVFTLCDDEDTRRAFVDNLVGLIRAPDADHRLILTMRIDFEDFVTRLPEFHVDYAEAVVRVTPLTAAELRAAIEGPAEMVGLKFEGGVVDALLQDILGEPAALPLLQFTLLKLWDHRERNRVTWEIYRRLGGGRQALAHSADELYESLIPEDQVAARRILLRMVRPAEGLEVTSNRIRREVLYRAGEARDRIDRVLERLVEARLVRLTQRATPADDQVEVAHEALVRNWPRLVNWLEDERELMRRRLRLTAAAERWQSVGRDPGGLLRGALLDEALRYEDLNDLEAEFVRASRDEIQRVHEEEISRQRELARAQALAEAERERAEVESRARKRLLWLVAALGVVLALAVVATLYASGQQQRARQEANARATEVVVRRAAQAQLEAERDRAERQLHKTTALQLAAVAVNNLDIDPERSILLALEAVSATRDDDGSVTDEAVRALQRAVLVQHIERSLFVDDTWVAAVAFSPEGTRLAAAVGSEPRVWAAGTGEELLTLSEWHNLVADIAFSPDGSLLATAHGDFTALLWDAATGQPLHTLSGHEKWVWAVAFSPDGRRLATASWDGTAKVWDVESGQELFTLAAADGSLKAVAFSPDGALLATGCSDGTVKVWDVASGTEILKLPGDAVGVESVAFSPDGRYLISAGWDDVVYVWELATAVGLPAAMSGGQTGQTSGVEQALLTLRGHTSTIYDLDFSPDGVWLATASADRTAKVWDWEASLAAGSGVELYTLPGHADAVEGIDFSRDGRYLATCSDDGSVRLWNLSGGQELVAPRAPRSAVYGLAFSKDGAQLATGSAEGTVKLWDVESGRELASFPDHPDLVWRIAFSPDGSRLAVVSWNTLSLWDLASGDRLLEAVVHETGIGQVSFSPDGQRLVTVGDDKVGKIWDLDALVLDPDSAPLQTLEGHTDWIAGSDFSEDGARVLTLSRDNTAKVWDALTGRELATLSCPIGEEDPFAINETWAQFAIGSGDGTVRLCDPATGEDQFTFTAASGEVNSLNFSPDGKRLVTVSGSVPTLWELPAATASGSPRALFSLPSHLGGIRNYEFSRDGSRLVTASVAGTVKVWDVEASAATGAGVELYTLPDHRDGRVRDEALSPDGTRLATATWQMAEVVDLVGPSDAAEPETLPLCCHDRWVNYVAFSPDGKQVATVSDDQTTKVWDSQTGELLLTLGGHSEGVRSLAFSPDGRLLATGSQDHTVMVWDLEAAPPEASEEPLHALTGRDWIDALAFSPDGKALVAGGSDGRITVWGLPGEEELISVEAAPNARINDLAFSPDGRFLVTAGSDRTAKVWDLSSANPEREYLNLLGHIDSVEEVVFSPDGRRLATGCGDGSTRVWDFASGKELFYLPGDPSGVQALQFTLDGGHLLSCSPGGDGEGGSLRMYTLDVEELRVKACNQVTRNLSQDEWEVYIGPDRPYRETCPGLPVPP